MSDDRSSQVQKSWLERITQAFAHEPKSRQELLEVLREAHDNKLLDTEALNIVEGAIQVADLQVRDIMIPRSQIISVKAGQTPREFLPAIIEAAHSRYPVVGEHLDEVLGVLLAKDLLPLILEQHADSFDLRPLLRPATFVPESKGLNDLLREFRGNRNHLAIVIDEFGRVAGLITIEDVLEEIVGEIEDEFDVAEDEGDIFALADSTWRVSGDTPIERINESFGLALPEDDFDTIGGLIAHSMGHVPKRGETHDLESLQFVVLHTKGGAVKWFKVMPRPTEP